MSEKKLISLKRVLPEITKILMNAKIISILPCNLNCSPQSGNFKQLKFYQQQKKMLSCLPKCDSKGTFLRKASYNFLF